MELGNEEGPFVSVNLLTQLNMAGAQPLTRVLDAVEQHYPNDYEAMGCVIVLYRCGAINLSHTPPKVSLTDMGCALADSLKSEGHAEETWFPKPPLHSPRTMIPNLFSKIRSGLFSS